MVAEMSMPDKPLYRRGLLSRVVFAHVGELVSRGVRARLEEDDLPPLPPASRCANLVAQYKALGGEERGAFKRTIVRMYTPAFRRLSLLKSIYLLQQLSSPMLLRLLMRAIADPDSGARSFIFACLMGAGAVIGAVAEQHHEMTALEVGQDIRSLCIGLVYRKVAALSVADLTAGAGGMDVPSLVGSDVQKVPLFLPTATLLWAAPLQIVIGMTLLLWLLGAPALAGVSLLFLLVPFNMMLARRMMVLRQAHMPLIDKRNQLCSEMCRGMRGIKLNGWVPAFLEQILAARKKEEAHVMKELKMFGWIITAVIVTPQFATMLTYLAFTLPSNVALNAPDAFAGLALFNILRFPLMKLGDAVTSAANAKTALDRLAKFIDIPSFTLPRLSSTNGGVSVDDASFSWPTPSDDVPTSTKHRGPEADELSPPGESMQHIEPNPLAQGEKEMASAAPAAALAASSFSVAPGELLVVVGRVGCFKSTLLQGLLGEARRTGTVRLPWGQMAYCSQQAWLCNASVRDNITFGKPFDEVWFRQVLDACRLWPDIAMLPALDRTVVGERGVTLSGGQKSRVALARAVYARPSAILLDDPLSALDAETGRAIFTALLGGDSSLSETASAPTGSRSRKGLFSGCAVILVTHAVQYLSRATNVLVLHDSRVAFHGSHRQLCAAAAGAVAAGEPLATVLAPYASTSQEKTRRSASLDLQEVERETMSPPKVLALEDGTHMLEEDRSSKAVTSNTYRAYLVANGGLAFLVALLFVIALERVTYVGTDLWLAVWTGAETVKPSGTLWGWMHLPLADGHATLYAMVYLGACVVNSIFAMTRTQFPCHAGALAAKRAFRQLITSVIHSPMLFFESTPTGRLLNRFTNDTDVMDYVLVTKSLQAMASIGWFLTSFFVIAVVLPLMTIPLTVVAGIYFAIYRRFIVAYAQLQRIDANAKSPLLIHIQESAAGASVLRAYSLMEEWTAKCDQLVDETTRAFNAFNSAGRWLAVRVEAMGALILICVGFLAWYYDELSASLVGIVIVWALHFTTSLNFITISWSEVDSKIVSAERVIEYCQLPPEGGPAGQDLVAPPPQWPSRGVVEFRHAVLTYRPGLEPALRGLTLSVAGGEHVGVVGRTGAGKSTIAVALFRICELAGGSIHVDGMDLSRMALADVRGRGMAIIPQDPLMLAGTLRRNLDPFDKHDDDALWEALDAVHMRAAVAELPLGLRDTVEEGGVNWSVGEQQREWKADLRRTGLWATAQLLCFARVLLRKPRILVLDEATASVDHRTDDLIQATLRRSCRDVTLLTVAHRLNTVMDSDRIVVMGHGRALEAAAPAALLENPGSALSALVDSLGKEAAARLKQSVRPP